MTKSQTASDSIRDKEVKRMTEYEEERLNRIETRLEIMKNDMFILRCKTSISIGLTIGTIMTAILRELGLL